MTYKEILRNHEKLTTRRKMSEEKLVVIKNEFNDRISQEKHPDISIFCGGSLGRGDLGDKSDLDLFILFNKSANEEKRIETFELFYEIISINKRLGYPQFSNDAQYLKNYSFPDMLKVLGSPQDDNENLFTVRMLLLLESKPIFNDDLYGQHIKSTLDNYFRDSRGKDSFKPLFLLNDILRYWRTLCLNYEIIRNNSEKPWRKKNINLKFSRMLTVFGTVLPIIAKPVATRECMDELVDLSPIQRLAAGLDMLDDESMSKDFSKFLNHYEQFLTLKEDVGEKLQLDDNSLDIRFNKMSLEFSEFIYKAVTHSHIKKDLVKFLVI